MTRMLSMKPDLPKGGPVFLMEYIYDIQGRFSFYHRL